ncbi:sulfotransferase [Marinicella sp. W31]|uniref:sulfotransferase n=1 Tax=Marinicella sp. W31 TaxID=3023713 RepID=UPI0037584D39
MESTLLAEELQSTVIQAPIYITALPRSGTTILAEFLSHHPHTAHHCYADFPNIYTPYWNRWRNKHNPFKAKKTERSHGDRILVNQDSIEAFEEVLWMQHFSDLHGQGISHQLPSQIPEEFVNNYCNHIKKLLLFNDTSRYLSKANYNINRLKLITELFPDARFVVPVRHPVNHLASLMKQHERFTQAGLKNSKIDKQLASSGHFEFGQLREVVDMGDSVANKKIQSYWNHGDELNGWAHYWDMFYTTLFQLKKTTELGTHMLFVRYEDLCCDSNATLENVLQHCQLNSSIFSEHRAQYTEKLSLPNYYTIPFDQKQIDTIMEVTEHTAACFGYDANNYFQE